MICLSVVDKLHLALPEAESTLAVAFEILPECRLFRLIFDQFDDLSHHPMLLLLTVVKVSGLV